MLGLMNSQQNSFRTAMRIRMIRRVNVRDLSERRLLIAGLLTFGLLLPFFAESSSAQDAPPPAEAPAPPATQAPPAPPVETAPPAVSEPAATAPTAKRVVARRRVAAKKAVTLEPKVVAKRAKKAAVTAKVAVGSVRGTSIEIDISRQVMLLRRGGKTTTIRVSTGSGRRYCSGGSCAIARTPRGRFRVQRRVSGWRVSRLGRLFNPLYFSGGYAIHGGNIPGYPASHGCVRVPMGVASWLPGSVPNGTPVWIHE